MDSPPPRLRAAVDEQSGNGIQLVPEVESNRSDWRLIAETGADGIPEVVQVDRPRRRPHVAGVENHDTADVAEQRRPQFGACREHAVAAIRLAGRAERTDFIAAPPADTGRAAEKIPFGKRNVLLEA